jgi:hypothetical protein
LPTISRLLAANVNALVFLAGYAVFYVGLAGFSRPAANTVSGLLLMGVAAWPYLARMRKKG